MFRSALMWRGGQKISATRWIETLNTLDSETLATYTDSHLDGRAAITLNSVSDGRVFHVGWLPNQAQVDVLVAMLLLEAQIVSIGIMPLGVVAGRRMREGERFLFLMNFTDKKRRVWLNGTSWLEARSGDKLKAEVNIAARTVVVAGRSH